MSGDVVMALQFMTGSVACILTFLYVLAIGKFSKLQPKEWGLLALGGFRSNERRCGDGAAVHDRISRVHPHIPLRARHREVLEIAAEGMGTPRARRIQI